jgi:hypothetical protein
MTLPPQHEAVSAVKVERGARLCAWRIINNN